MNYRAIIEEHSDKGQTPQDAARQYIAAYGCLMRTRDKDALLECAEAMALEKAS